LKYSDVFVSWLKDLGYTHCFYVAGGNIMHLLESASHVFECVPVVHEVSAGIASEYFNESQDKRGKKAFALVTAGPGLTNIVTAMAGAFLESRDLLVVGGQVKSTDLSHGKVRQLGIQEIDGMSLVSSLTVASLQIQKPLPRTDIEKVVISGFNPRKGPVFIEFCLDAQGAEFQEIASNPSEKSPPSKNPFSLSEQLSAEIRNSQRPVLLVGGGVSRDTAKKIQKSLENSPIPVMTTWNGTDRISSDANSYFGRPNTWGQRSANVILQQSDLLIALGTRLGLQQSGFNWEQFMPVGKIIQVDIDPSELDKKNPGIDYPVEADANEVLPIVLDLLDSERNNASWKSWVEFSATVKASLPTSENVNKTEGSFINPYDFYIALSEVLRVGDAVVPSSSGASETVAMQSLNQGRDNVVITTKGLASMGYGLAGAIGTAFAGAPRVFHVEGDGGFAQNIQELGTVAANKLNIKTFLLCNDGYASIRMTQKSYFDGHYLGCDSSTGLGLPNWHLLAKSFGISSTELDPQEDLKAEIERVVDLEGPQVILVPINPEQTYFPKITSQIDVQGNLISNPIHVMTPELSAEMRKKVFRYI
jgi:acetolactate synthase-1/2/3 large subunit